MEQKLGKLLFSITGAAEQMKAESEMLLQQETSRAIERFSERENEQN